MEAVKKFNLSDLNNDVPKPQWVADIKSLPQPERDDIIVSYDSSGAPRSRFRDDFWHMAGHFLVNNTTRTTMDFTQVAEGFREAAKIYIWESLFARGTTKALNTLNSTIRCLASNATILKALGGHNWVYLESDEHYANWISEIASREYAIGTLKITFKVINRFSKYGLLNRYIPEPSKLAKKLGVEQKQTPCLPEQIAIALYSHSLSIVKEWHPYATAIKNASADYIKIMASEEWKLANNKKKNKIRNQLMKNHGIPSNFSINGNWSGHVWLAGMCYVVIAGFTGMRYNEVASATEMVWHEKKVDDDNVIPYVHSKLSKTKKGVPVEADWVTIPDVKLALELWRTIYDPLRNKHRKEVETSDRDEDTKVKLLREIDGLCISGRINKKKIPSYTWDSSNLNAQINREIKAIVKAYEKENEGQCSPLRLTEKTLAEFNELNEDHAGDYEVGDVLPFSAHMTRRTLAVFVLRNRLGSLIDLKHQFKHLNIYMTQWYTNGSMHAAFMDLMLDPDFQDELRTIHVDIQTDVVMGFINDDELGGKKGKAIMDERDQDDAYLEGESRIYMTRAEVKKRIELGIMSVVDLPFGYCTNANCSRVCNSAQSTQTCAHEIITKEKAEGLIPHYQAMIRTFERRNNSGRYMPALLAKARLDIKALQKTFTDLGIEFEPYDPVINNNNKSIVVAA